VIVVVPPPTPVIRPDVEPIVATEVLLLLHVALPPMIQVSADELASQIFIVPLIAGGGVVALISLVTKQPLLTVYVTVVVPAAIPVTSPVAPFTVPAAGLLELHTPPAVA
jgi:hypothetical protein